MTEAMLDILDSMSERPADHGWRTLEFVEDTGRTKDQVHDHLSRLMAEGLVEKRTSPWARAGYVLTPKGIEALRRLDGAALAESLARSA